MSEEAQTTLLPLERPRRAAVLVATTETVPGFEIVEVLGTVFGLAVRSEHMTSRLGVGVRAFVGGEPKGITVAQSATRREAIDRMTAQAGELGANAVVAMRFDASELGGIWTELCAYGTAVRIQPVGARSKTAEQEGRAP
jgi:uncharacterized protein YbjQ (UPF0145 family)